MTRWINFCPCPLCVESKRRDEIRRTLRCLVVTLALVGVAAVVAGVSNYFAAA